MDPVTAKFVITLIALAIAAALVWFGYRLFTGGIASNSSGGLSAAGVKVNWRTAGPGIGFMLLGAVIALAGILRPMSRNDQLTTPDGLQYSYSTAAGMEVAPERDQSSPPSERPGTEPAIER